MVIIMTSRNHKCYFIQSSSSYYTLDTCCINYNKSTKSYFATIAAHLHESLGSSLDFHQFNAILCVSLIAARERILSNLQKHPVPCPAPEVQQQKAPVAEVPTACLTDSKAAAELVQQDLGILGDQARYITRGKQGSHACIDRIHVLVCTHRNTLAQIYIMITKYLLILGLGLQWRVKPSRWQWSRSCWRAFLSFTRTNQSKSPWPWSVKGREGSRARDQQTSLSQ